MAGLTCALPEFVRAAGVLAYLAAENEIPTDALVSTAVDAGKSTYLPKCAGDIRLVAWQPGEAVVRGRGGVLEPEGDRAAKLVRPAVALLPLVAWDASGTRLGRGGGVYDRLLADLGNGGPVTRVGLAYEFQEVPELPREAWDVPLDYVITERRVVRCKAAVASTLQEGGLLA